MPHRLVGSSGRGRGLVEDAPRERRAEVVVDNTANSQCPLSQARPPSTVSSAAES